MYFSAFNLTMQAGIERVGLNFFNPKIFMRILWLLFIALNLAACSGIKTLPAGEKLYTGAKVKVVSIEKLRDKGEVKSRVKAAVQPKPNAKFLGNRPKVWIYNITNDSAARGFKRWLHTKMGEPPVLMKDVRPQSTKEIIDAVLFNMGIFNGTSESKIVENKKTGSVLYTIHAHNPYTIKNVSYPADTGGIAGAIVSVKEKSLLRSGRNYDLNSLRVERKRVDDALKNLGYYFFREDYLLFKADTSREERSVSIAVTLKDDVPPGSLEIYMIKTVSVESDYSLAANDSAHKDTAVINGVRFAGKTAIRPKVILRSVFIKENEIYSRKNHNITLSRLMGMGTFKFVKLNFTTADTSYGRFLNADIHLTPSPGKSVQAELQTVSKSNDFIGPALTVQLLNRNALKGAELMKIRLKGSLETQLTGKDKNIFSYDVGPEIEFLIPRFLTPFRIRQSRSIYIPKTKFSLGFDYMQRVNYYDLSSFKFQYGYLWKENIKIDHELNPVTINYFSVTNKSVEFEALLAENPFFRRSFDDQFIAGIHYSYTFNEQVIPNQESQFFLRFTTDFAGNTLTAYYQLAENRKADPEQPLTVAGIPYSQFMRFTIDVRNYFNLDAKNKIIIRIYTGLGYPYGNSSTLPYVKQFFSGGPGSVRAFRINSLGPGVTPPDSISNSILRSGGDLKLEGNVEYRFPLYRIVKGALFFDSGNMWIQKKDSSDVYTGFDRSKLISQLAAGAGFGLRFDASFFVLRFDLAFPVRKPWLESGNRWVFNEFTPSSAVLNIAIGYPF
jgi:outer membrane protein insertion porin family